MSARRELVLLRVRTVLVDLERQAEGRAMSWEGRVKHGKPDSSPLFSTGRSDIETVLNTLEAWCLEAEKRVTRGRPKPETTQEELIHRLKNDYVGRNSLKVAEDEGCTQGYIEDLRARLGFTRRDGRPAQRKRAA